MSSGGGVADRDDKRLKCDKIDGMFCSIYYVIRF